MLAPIRPRAARPAADPMIVPVEFNARSKATLGEVNPTLAELMTEVERRHPDAFEIGEGMRDIETQKKYVAEGKSQTMNSKHLHGNAVDIALIGPDGKPNWNFEDYRPIADTAKAVAAEMGIPDFVWGGDWKTLKDGVHFQLGGPAATSDAAGVAGNVPLSFGKDVPAVQDPSAMGLAAMFGTGGPGGLDMGVGSLLPPRKSAEQMLLAQAQQEEDLKRKIALADLMRF
jgi:peptidoglycan L-alanyl-D-glutamate endopeptidase CwlK